MRFSDATKRRRHKATKEKARFVPFVAPSLRRFVAFSLIEIMIVVVIIGLMAGVITYATAGYLEKAKVKRAKADIATLVGAVDAFYLDKGRYPENSEGLKVLAPQFVKTIQPDPWGHPYQYVQPGKGGAFDVISLGADGREGGSGADVDITNWDIEQAKPAGNKQ